ncbi:rcc01693 family protein [Pseudooceanicola sp. C21-150M6]|uniref:rcc01693 family protein n=1 Tax=Pseudooceanicola sp. C21-150M6 TaxID=3434355 RepID=UPI003D7F3A4B
MKTDWAGLLRAGLIGLRLRPAEFWALTPAELRMMLGDAGDRPLDRRRLDELLEAFPDEVIWKEGGENGRD